MHLKLHLKLALLLLVCSSLVAPVVCAESSVRKVFTLQVASFPGVTPAREFAGDLARKGIPTSFSSVTIQGKGNWTRVYAGRFKTASDAQQYGQKLLTRGLIREFIVTQVSDADLVTGPLANYHGAPGAAAGILSSRLGATGAAVEPDSRPRLVTTGLRLPSAAARLSPDAQQMYPGSGDRARFATESGAANHSTNSRKSSGVPLPTAAVLRLGLSSSVNPSLLPRPNPVQVAFNAIAGGRSVDGSKSRGGLWISGEVGEALDRLRWIVGPENADLISATPDGRIRLDTSLLGRLAGVDRSDGAGAPMLAANYIFSNEGLLLLVQLTEGANRYRLHLGALAPTAGAPAKVIGSVNLDTNFDSRINPYRREQRKLPGELPPEGLEALIAINPQARWFNIPAHSLVPVGLITFHELAESYAKVQFGLDYLVQPPLPGAHNTALEREKILKLQRPSSDVVLTAGSNRVIRLGEEMRRFYAESSGSSTHDR